MREKAERRDKSKDHLDCNELCKIFLEQTSHGIFIADKKGALLEVNQQLCDLLGYKRDKVLTIPISHIILGDSIARLTQNTGASPDKKNHPVQGQMRDHKGDLLTVDLNIRTLSGGYYLGIVYGVKKQKKVEQQFLENDERFQLLTESSLTGVYLIQNGRFTYVNQAFADMFGYEIKEILNDLKMTDLIYPEDHSLVIENIRRREEREEDSMRYGFRGVNSDGSIIYVEVHGRNIQYKGKVGVIGTTIDISEAKKAEQNLHRLNEELEEKIEERTLELKQSYRELKLAHANLLHQEKMASIGQLAAGIAHEINTPIQFVGDNITFLRESIDELVTGIQSCQQIAESANDNNTIGDIQTDIKSIIEDTDFDYLKEEIPQAFKSTIDGIKHISSIVSAMKDFSHSSGNKLEPVDIESLINTAVKISSNAWKTVAELKVKHATPPLIVKGLRDALGQVLLNLITNAADAISEVQQDGNTLGSIIIETRISKENWAEIVVKDSGCGISPGLQKNIFEPFFTTKAVGRGSGQGLAIAYNIVRDKHDGEILVDSSPGKGSTFTIRLPYSI